MDLVKRFEIYLVQLDPTIGSEIKKTRPCIIVSPNESNQYLNTVIVAPLTTTTRNYPTRINLTFQQKSGQIALDQIRTIDKLRLRKKIGNLTTQKSKQLSSVLTEMFKY